jgi:hypothetical protein
LYTLFLTTIYIYLKKIGRIYQTMPSLEKFMSHVIESTNDKRAHDTAHP